MTQGIGFRGAARNVGERGPKTFTEKARYYLSPRLEPVKKIVGMHARRAIKRLDPNERNVDALLDIVLNRFGGLLRFLQVRSEIASLGNIVKELKPKTVLEIGTRKGGTLFLFSRLADAEATVVSVDLPGGEFGGGYPEWKIELYQSFRLPQQTMHLVRADSHAPETHERVQSIFGRNPIDFVFLDGDHTYEGVKKDFEFYSKLVRKGGVIAFHDIANHPPESSCRVDKFWNEIKKEDSKELIEDREQQWAGIGVYYNP
jgi:cephalosporin hydroxylase